MEFLKQQSFRYPVYFKKSEAVDRISPSNIFKRQHLGSILIEITPKKKQTIDSGVENLLRLGHG